MYQPSCWWVHSLVECHHPSSHHHNHTETSAGDHLKQNHQKTSVGPFNTINIYDILNPLKNSSMRLSARWASELLWQPPEEHICEITVKMLCIWNVLCCILLEIKLLLLQQFMQPPAYIEPTLVLCALCRGNASLIFLVTWALWIWFLPFLLTHTFPVVIPDCFHGSQQVGCRKLSLMILCNIHDTKIELSCQKICEFVS